MRALALFFVLYGCRTPCAAGFTRDSAGLCRADTQCAPGTERGENLACIPFAVDETDTGKRTGAQVDSGGQAVHDTGDSISANLGRIRMIWEDLTDVPVHGFVVMAIPEGAVEPAAAYCVVILQQSIDIDGFLVPYTSGEDPCAITGDPAIFDSGLVQVRMEVVSGADSAPVLCDEREVTVMGDVAVDFTGINSCES